MSGIVWVLFVTCMVVIFVCLRFCSGCLASHNSCNREENVKKTLSGRNSSYCRGYLIKFWTTQYTEWCYLVISAIWFYFWRLLQKHQLILQIRNIRKLQIWSHLLKKSLTENIIFCEVILPLEMQSITVHLVYFCRLYHQTFSFSQHTVRVPAIFWGSFFSFREKLPSRAFDDHKGVT